MRWTPHPTSVGMQVFKFRGAATAQSQKQLFWLMSPCKQTKISQFAWMSQPRQSNIRHKHNTVMIQRCRSSIHNSSQEHPTGSYLGWVHCHWVYLAGDVVATVRYSKLSFEAHTIRSDMK